MCDLLLIIISYFANSPKAIPHFLFYKKSIVHLKDMDSNSQDTQRMQKVILLLNQENFN